MSMNNEFPYKTFGGWVRSLGLKLSDLTDEELKEAQEEYEARKRGEEVLDGLASRSIAISMRSVTESSI